MGKTIKPPKDITSKFFVLIYERFSELYKLALPDGSSYLLGGSRDTREYLIRVLKGNSDLVERGMDFAYNFIVSQVIPEKDRAFPLDSASFKSNDGDEGGNKTFKVPQDLEDSNWKPLFIL